MRHRSFQQIRQIASFFLAGILTIGLTREIPVFADTKQAAEEQVYPYIEADGETKYVDAATVINDQSVELETGWYIVTENVTVSERMVVNGDVNLILADGAKLDAQSGITVSAENSLTIYAQSFGDNAGALVATAQKTGYAGIGGYADKEWTITISGSDVTLTVNGKAPDYGHENIVGSCGTVVINGGRIEATGSELAAGIGGGIEGSCGIIEINNGTVTADSVSWGAGIGSGSYFFHEGGTVNVNGGTVRATGGSWAAGIGGGMYSSGCSVTITGGTVTAVGGRVTETRNVGGAGIGTGVYQKGCSVGSGTVNISGGTVAAIGGEEAAGIGGGANHGPGADVTISGGTVIAVSGDNLCGETEHNEEGEENHAPAGIGSGGCDLQYENGTVLHCDDTNDPKLTANGSFSTVAGGTAVIMANTIADDSQMESWSGIFTLTGGGTNQTAIYGSQNLARDFEIGAGDTLTIEANGSLTVNENVTLSNSGTIVNKSSLMIAGTLTNHASINNDGTILVAGTLMNLSESDLGTVLYRVNVTGGAADAEYASPGAAVTLTPETVIPEGMTAVWMLGNETISNSSFEMPASAVSIRYEGYKEIETEDAPDEEPLPQEAEELPEQPTDEEKNESDNADTDGTEAQETETKASEAKETATGPFEESQPSDTLISQPKETTEGEAASEKTAAGEAASEKKTSEETTAEETTAEAAAVEKTTEEEESAVAAGERKPEEISAASEDKTAAMDRQALSEEEKPDEASGMEQITAEDSSISGWVFALVLAVLAAVVVGTAVYRKKRQAAGAEA